jgi:hypothetical protein
LFDVKFPYGTQLTFGSLTFAAREDGNLRMLPLGPAPEHQSPAHGQDLCHSTTSSTSGGACLGSDSCAGLYIRTAKLVQGISVGTSSLRSSAASPDQDISDDYLEIRISTCGVSTRVGRLIFMTAPNGEQSHHSSSRYLTIGRSEVFAAWTPVIPSFYAKTKYTYGWYSASAENK